MHVLCGATLWSIAACCSINAASNNPKPYLQQAERTLQLVLWSTYPCCCMYNLTYNTCAADADKVLMAPNTRRQQVGNEGNVVRRHGHFLLSWLLFVLPVIVWRTDLVQCSFLPTVIKPHYSFFTTPVLLETQWATSKQCICLVTVWPLPDHPLISTLLIITFPAIVSHFPSLLHLLQQTS